MKQRARYRTLLGLLGVTAMLAAGCELVVDFNRSLIDGGALFDASVSDGQEGDGTVTDGPGSDGRVNDTGTDATRDQSAPDATAPDGGDATAPDAADATPPVDARVPDTSVADTSVPDTSVADTSVPDTSVADTSVPDTSVADTSVPDTSVADTSVPDTSVPDADLGDAGDASAQCNAVSTSGAPLAPITATASAAPALLGGTIADGTYFAESATRYGDSTSPPAATLTSVWVVSNAGSGTATVEEAYVDTVQQVTLLTRTFTLSTAAGGQPDAAADGGVTALEIDTCPVAATLQAGYEVRPDPDGGAASVLLYASPPNAQGQTLVRTYVRQ